MQKNTETQVESTGKHAIKNWLEQLPTSVLDESIDCHLQHRRPDFPAKGDSPHLQGPFTPGLIITQWTLEFSSSAPSIVWFKLPLEQGGKILFRWLTPPSPVSLTAIGDHLWHFFSLIFLTQCFRKPLPIGWSYHNGQNYSSDSLRKYNISPLTQGWHQIFILIWGSQTILANHVFQKVLWDF